MHGEKRGLPNLLVGIPNDQLLDPEGIDYWTGICIEVLCAVPEKIGVAPRHMVYGNTD
jgi:predicted N-formylglutamate amidohydrolase